MPDTAVKTPLIPLNRLIRITVNADVPFTVPSVNVYAPPSWTPPADELVEHLPRDLAVTLARVHPSVTYALDDPDELARYPPPPLKRACRVKDLSKKAAVEVRLIERISWHMSRTWHVYRACVAVNGVSHRVIAKVMSPVNCVDRSVVPHVYHGGEPVERAVNEDIIYRERLQSVGIDGHAIPLEGNVVPAWHGLFVDDQHTADTQHARLVVALVDDAGALRLSRKAPWSGVATVFRPTVSDLLRRLYVEGGIRKVEGSWDCYNVFGSSVLGEGDLVDHKAAIRIACFGRWVVRSCQTHVSPEDLRQMASVGQAEFDQCIRPYMEEE